MTTQGEAKDDRISESLSKVRDRTGSGSGSPSNPPAPNSADATPGGGGQSGPVRQGRGPVGEDVPMVDEVNAQGLQQTKTAEGVSLAYGDEVQDMPDQMDPGPDPDAGGQADVNLAHEDEAQEIQSEEDLMTLIPNENQQQQQAQPTQGQAQQQARPPQGRADAGATNPNPPAPDGAQQYTQNEDSQIVTPGSSQQQAQQGQQAQRQQRTQQQQQSQEPNNKPVQSSSTGPQNQQSQEQPNDPAQQVIQLCREFTDKIRNIRLSTQDREVLREKLDFIGDEVGDNVLEAVIEELDL